MNLSATHEPCGTCAGHALGSLPSHGPRHDGPAPARAGQASPGQPFLGCRFWRLQPLAPPAPLHARVARHPACCPGGRAAMRRRPGRPPPPLPKSRPSLAAGPLGQVPPSQHTLPRKPPPQRTRTQPWTGRAEGGHAFWPPGRRPGTRSRHRSSLGRGGLRTAWPAAGSTTSAALPACTPPSACPILLASCAARSRPSCPGRRGRHPPACSPHQQLRLAPGGPPVASRDLPPGRPGRCRRVTSGIAQGCRARRARHPDDVEAGAAAVLRGPGYLLR